MITVKGFTFNPVQENTYILFNDKLIGCIIDPGCYYKDEKTELLDFIDEYKIDIKSLLNTHCHLDHVFGNKFIFETYGTLLNIHEKEKPVLAFAPAFGKDWNLPFENYDDELLFLNAGDLVLLGEDKLKVLFTPGHSPGHICFYCEEQQFIIGGDVLFKGSIGRTDLPGGDYNTLLQSIREELFTLPDEVIVYPGHGEPTTIGFEKKNNPFFK